MERARRDVGISLSNIERLSGHRSSLDTRKKAHIREIARSVLRFLPGELSFEEGENFRRSYSELCERLNFEERVEFCRFLVNDIGKNELFLTKKLLETQPVKKEACVTYVKNALSDIAFEKFSADFDRTQVYYAADFEQALEDVYYSRADYAILPIASNKLGRMQHFFELMLRHEMKTVLSHDVHSNTDDSENTFLLLSKNCEFRFEKGEKLFFEFVLSEPKAFLVPILKAAQSYNCAYSSAHTSPENDFVTLCLDVSEGDIDAFCLYMFLEAPRHIPLGLYKK